LKENKLEKIRHREMPHAQILYLKLFLEVYIKSLAFIQKQSWIQRSSD